mmetsp:Transcript_12621/g.36852  ORF Transcript_12621/g.36852 Transcript_12621/m.36852 type:complete len:238 (+) Transcript_12621:237-950(+)
MPTASCRAVSEAGVCEAVISALHSVPARESTPSHGVEVKIIHRVHVSTSKDSPSSPQSTWPFTAAAAPLPHLPTGQASLKFLWHMQVHALVDFHDAPRGDRIVVRQQCHGSALLARPTSAANTVHIVLLLVRWVKVDDQPDGADVEAARSHVRGHEHAAGARLEQAQRLVPLALVLVPVDRDATLNPQGHRLAHPLGVDKHNHLILVSLPNDALETVFLLARVRTADNVLLDIRVHA